MQNADMQLKTKVSTYLNSLNLVLPIKSILEKSNGQYYQRSKALVAALNMCLEKKSIILNS